MQIHSTYKRVIRLQSAVLVLLLICMLFSSCATDPLYWKLRPDEQTIGDYIYNNPDQYSEFAKLIELTGLKGVLNVKGPYTVFVPTNAAMFEYYKEKKVNSLTNLSDASRQSLIRNHILCITIITNDIRLGALRDTNALGDYLETEFNGSEIYLNKTSKIVQRNIQVANGYIHVLDKVLDPLTKDIYSVVSDDPAYKIFSEGLRLTGIKDTLQIIAFPYGKRTVRTRYTILAVPDTIYQRFEIHNVQELIAWCGASPNELKSKENPFYKYMDYHCLINTYYLHAFADSGVVYPVLSGDNNISIITNDDYKINIDNISHQYTGFIISATNIPAKNGVIHTVNGLLPVSYPKPIEFNFETTDFFDLKQEDCYQNYYMKWTDGQNSFAKIKFQGDYLQYYYNANYNYFRGSLINNDCLSMSGFWWIEITTPNIIKGIYEVSANIWCGGSDFPSFEVYIDEIKVTEIDASQYSEMKFAKVNWSKSGNHKIKLVCTREGRLFWDYIRFSPVER